MFDLSPPSPGGTCQPLMECLGKAKDPSVILEHLEFSGWKMNIPGLLLSFPINQKSSSDTSICSLQRKSLQFIGDIQTEIATPGACCVTEI